MSDDEWKRFEEAARCAEDHARFAQEQRAELERKEDKAKLVAAVVIVIAIILVLRSLLPDSGKKTSAPHAPTAAPTSAAPEKSAENSDDRDYAMMPLAKTGYLRNEDNSDVLVFTSKEALEQVEHAASTGDRLGFMQIVRESGLSIKSGTEIFYLESSGWLEPDFKVRIMEAPHYGAAVWVPAKMVHTTKERKTTR